MNRFVSEITECEGAKYKTDNLTKRGNYLNLLMIDTSICKLYIICHENPKTLIVYEH